MNNIWIATGPGIGDVLLTMRKDPFVIRIPEIRRNNPGWKAGCVIMSNTSDAGDIVRNSGWFDEVVFEPFPTPELYDCWHQGMIERMKDRGYPEEVKRMTWSNKLDPSYRFDVTLTEEEQTIVNSIRSCGAYVFMHLFSSTSYKAPAPYIDIPALVDLCIDKHGLNVVLVGKNHNFGEPWSRFGHPGMQEMVDYKRDGFFNLTGNGAMPFRIRAALKLCESAMVRIVAESAYLQAVALYNVNHLCLFGAHTRAAYEHDIPLLDYYDTLREGRNPYYDVAEIKDTFLDVIDGYIRGIYDWTGIQQGPAKV